jgi:CDP-glycerol glycerophosphotransferase
MRIVWSSFEGRYSDSPRALYEALRDRPGTEHTWLAHERHRHRFPDGTTTVDPGTPAARAALEAADLVVASSHVEVRWRKRPGTTYLQTWHGTPLKRVHHDVLWAPPGRLAWLDEDVARWDLLLSPNPASTPRLRQAFRYSGEVLESGYPRNDLLASPGCAAAGARQRAALGIPPEATVVLYAPTWRDDEVQAADPRPVPLGLDPATFCAGLADDHLLLVRAHTMVRELWQLPEQPRVREVTFEPDVRDLLAAADVLVTDYSSLMFDYTITRRPVVFHAFDLERYASTTRGFYFDLVAEAPGPVVASSAEVVDAIRRLPEVRREYAARYDAFRRRYTGLEDGHATDRVLARLGL